MMQTRKLHDAHVPGRRDKAIAMALANRSGALAGLRDSLDRFILGVPRADAHAARLFLLWG